MMTDRQMIAADAWRGSLAVVDDCLFWIANHQRVLREGRENPKFLAYTRARLAERIREYRDALQVVSMAAAELGK